MKKEVEKILISRGLRDIESDIASITYYTNIAEFAEYQSDHIVKEKMRLKELEKEQKTLQEEL